MSKMSDYLIEISECVENQSENIITSNLAAWLFQYGYKEELNKIIYTNDTFFRIQKSANIMNGLAKKLSFKDDKEYIYTFIEARSEKIILAEELKEYINTFKDDEERKETLIYYIEISQITDRKNRLYEFIDNAPNQEQDFTDFYKTILY